MADSQGYLPNYYQSEIAEIALKDREAYLARLAYYDEMASTKDLYSTRTKYISSLEAIEDYDSGGCTLAECYLLIESTVTETYLNSIKEDFLSLEKRYIGFS